MDSLIGKTVIHKSWGYGTVSAQNDGIITVKFNIGEKRFQYPEGFRVFLAFKDSKLNDEIQAQLTSMDTEKEATNKKAPVSKPNINLFKKHKRIRSEKPNIAFKCNYCDGGASNKCVGFNGVCSDKIIKNNIEVEHRTWCCSKNSGCLSYLEGKITRRDLDALMNDNGYVCYESQMLREWKAMAGIVQNGERLGQPMHLNHVQENSLCILTTRDPDKEENERYIFAVFLVDSSYNGDDTDEGFVTTRSEYKLKLSPKEAHQMLFWKYHANNKQPDVSAWSSGLHRYLTDVEAAQVLFDITKLKRGTSDEELASRFYKEFCEATNVDTESLSLPCGALQ